MVAGMGVGQHRLADAGALRRALDATTRRFGALHGVIHAAGIVGRDGYQELREVGGASCESHFRAKALGLQALDRALEGREIDFCLLMSSLASVLGGLGQAAYASANLYMDTYVRRQRRASSVRWLSVNWDVWRLGGESDAEAGATLKDLGMTAAEGVARDERGFVLTGPDLQPEHLKAWPLERAPFLLETCVPGIFAAGDVRHQSVKRVASAVGEGSVAVAFVHQHLANL